MKNILFILISIISIQVYGQEERDLKPIEEVQDTAVINDLALLFKSTTDGVIVRWAPTNAKAWLLGNQYGYTLEKIAFDSLSQERVKLVDSKKIQPWPLEKWEDIVGDDYPYRATAAMTIHGKTKTETGFVKQAEDLETRFGMALLSADLDPVAAEASGLRYIDNDVTIGKVYMYRISINSPETTDTLEVVDLYGHRKPTPAISPELLEPIAGDKLITLQWFRPYKGGYSGFYIERSEDGTHFEKINKLPFLDVTTNLTERINVATYRDSIAENGKTYSYRLLGIDAFGDVSKPSNVVQAKGVRVLKDAMPTNVAVSEIEKETLTITWDKPKNPKANTIGYHVYKSLDLEGNYVKITPSPLSPKTYSFVDPKPDQRETNYYYVAAVDKNDNEATSSVAFGFTKDELPPQSPTSLQGKIDNNGMLLLRWEAPEDNDIRGYQVFYSNSPNTTFAVKPGNYLPNTHFVDSLTLRTLTEDIYYYVIAIDWSYNQSEPSEIIKVNKPDIIPPEPSIFTNYKVSMDGIYFEWKASTSRDVKNIQLKRKTADADFNIVSDFDPTTPTYLDKNIEEGKSYEYILVTIDDDGLETICDKHLVLEALKSFYIQEVSEIKLERSNKGVQVYWKYDEVSKYDFIIYRAEKGGSLSTLKRVSGQNTYLDTSADTKKSYNYAIKAKARDGRESKMVRAEVE